MFIIYLFFDVLLSVPLTSRYQMHLRKLTTYDHFFNNQLKPGMEEIKAAIDAGKLVEYIRSANEKGVDLKRNREGARRGGKKQSIAFTVLRFYYRNQ